MDLRHAVDRGELRVVYQPIVGLRDGALAGFEALVRWEHPQLGLLMPDAFLEPAEESGQMALVDQWVLREACRQAAGWAEARGPERTPLRIHVNCSGQDLASTEFSAGVLQALDGQGLSPEYLSLEITERALVQDTEGVSRELRRLQNSGIRFSLDDFGTGYSSLSMLHALPVDTIKVDRSFVGDMDACSASRQLVETVVGLGKMLGKSVVAEGIEGCEQLGALRHMECAFGQGYFFNRPLSTADATALAVSETTPWHEHWASV
jgi:EAL domain-containing protein (putative c-di-GMP-specific phosphodiesterase class I)